MKPEKTIFAPDASPLAVAILLMEESNAFSLAACVDPMRAANRRAGRTLFTWQYLSPAGGQVALTAGFGVATQALGDRADYDVLMIVAGFRLEEQATSDLLARLRRLAPQLKAMGGVDGGNWFLARAGLLDGRAATKQNAVPRSPCDRARRSRPRRLRRNEAVPLTRAVFWRRRLK